MSELDARGAGTRRRVARRRPRAAPKAEPKAAPRAAAGAASETRKPGDGEPERVLVLGASAGGVQALCEVVGSLPADLGAAVFAVLHVSPYGRSAMPSILSRSGPLPAVHPEDGERIRSGRVYVAPPDLHMIVEPGAVRLSRGPSENGFRPAVDVLFRSAARSYRERVVAVVLTGNLDDGTAGLAAVKRHGGVAVVQDPADADYPGMPASAVRNVDLDYVLPLQDIPGVLASLCNPLPRQTAEHQPQHQPQHHTASGGGAANPMATNMKEQLELGADREAGGAPSGFTCPLCGGSLWLTEAGIYEHYRCRTGHAFSPESLFAQQSKSTELALWEALRSLEENGALSSRLARQARAARHGEDEGRYRQRQRAVELHAETLRRLLMQPDGLSGEG
jgi:two-component system, chemotaxis family, protein-glutamate methylesterase/glutaminase